MRIHKLYIENIASLKGGHEIDFDSLFNQSALFAITGKTGSGKSTLLNAISLALYGKVYKEDSSPSDFVTLGEELGSIDLYFSSKGQFYQSSWLMRIKKKNGEYLKKPQLNRNMAVKQDGKYLNIDKQIEDLINLNFDQFCKTSILNQGQFSKFLTSKFNERKDILEKFYNGINLESLNIKLKEKLRNNKSELEIKKNQIIGINGTISDIELNQSDLENLKLELREFKSLQTIMGSFRPDLLDFEKQYKTITENSLRLQSISEQIKLSHDKKNHLTLKFDQSQETLINAKDHFNKRAPILKICNEKTLLNNKNQEQYLYLQKQSEQLQKEIDAIDKELTQLNLKQKFNNQETSDLKLVDIEFFEKGLAEIEDEVIYKDIADLKSIFTKAKITHDEEKRLSLATVEQLKTIDTFNKESSDLKNYLDSIDPAELQNLIDENQSNLALINKYIDANKNFDHQILKSTNDIDSLNEKLAMTSTDELGIQKIMNDILADIETQHAAKSFYQLQDAIHLCLENSLKQNECIVCKNTDINISLQVASPDAQKLEKLNVKIETLQLSQTKTAKNLDQKKLAVLSLKSEISKLREYEQEIKKENVEAWTELLKTLNKIETEKSESNLLNFAAQTQEALKKLQEKKLEFYIKNDKLELLNSTIIDKNRQLELNNKILMEHRNTILGTKEKSNSILEKYFTQGYLSLTSRDVFILLEKLKSKVIQFKVLTTQAVALIDDLTRAKIQSQTLADKNIIYKKDIVSIQAEIEEIQNYLKQFLTNNQSPVHELKELEDSLLKLQTEQTKLLSQIKDEDIFLAESKSKLDNYTEQIKSSSLMIESYKKKCNIYKNTLVLFKQKSIHELSQEIINFINKLSNFECENLSLTEILNESISIFQNLFDDCQNEFTNKDRKYTEAKTLLKNKNDNLEKIKEIEVFTIEIEAHLLTLENLNQLIGKDEFRNYILSIIETSLIQQTNKELQTICQGRYALFQTNKKNRAISEFRVIDHFKDAMMRKVSTLSGGETFLVSLAMAMALAELTRGQTQLDSLFIDEGFGTLDQEAIEEVYELLLSIQHSGKQIGIISHIQELTSRIQVNINLEKNSHGTSQINIVQN